MTTKSQDADVAFIEALAELLRSKELTELEVKREYGEGDSLNVRVSRQIAREAPVAYAPAPAAAPAMLQAPASEGEPAAAPIEDPAQLPGAVTSQPVSSSTRRRS